MRPVVPMLFRQAMQDVSLGEFLIPAGTILVRRRSLGSPRRWLRGRVMPDPLALIALPEATGGPLWAVTAVLQACVSGHCSVRKQELHLLGMHTSPHVWERPNDFLPVLALHHCLWPKCLSLLPGHMTLCLFTWHCAHKL